jgi:hypothetical protein
MVPSDEFLRHSAECESMAAFSHDPANKAAWNCMAERWLRCAELAKKYSPGYASKKVKLHRKPVEAYAH